MIITCPNCQTKYQVADTAIGSAGRKVQCANCHQSWQARAELPPQPPTPPKPQVVAGTDTEIADGDRLFPGDVEADLDKSFEAEADRVHAIDEALDHAEVAFVSPGADDDDAVPDDALLKRRQHDLVRRHKRLSGDLPVARLRRAMRMVSLVTLMTLIGMAYQFRIDIVRAAPDLGGLYAAIGLPINIYGLELSNVQTLRSLKDGVDVMLISADIRSIVGYNVRVPPVLVSILDADGKPIYQWTARVPVDTMTPGDVVKFETQLTAAPLTATKVRLIFSNANAAETGGKKQAAGGK